MKNNLTAEQLIDSINTEYYDNQIEKLKSQQGKLRTGTGNYKRIEIRLISQKKEKKK